MARHSATAPRLPHDVRLALANPHRRAGRNRRRAARREFARQFVVSLGTGAFFVLALAATLAVI